MNGRVAITGVGFTPAQRATPRQSFKELMFEAAERAYADAGVSFDEVDSFVTCAEDLSAGISIFDEYTPDQLGAVRKPMHTLTQDGLHGIADAVMQIRAGIAETVVVEAHSKASNLLTPDWILDYALDPVYNRPLGFSPHALAGLEMNLFLHEIGLTAEDCARVASKNRNNALRNPAAAYPSAITPEDVAASRYLFHPLREAEAAQSADGCVVIVLASENKAKGSTPVWVRGVGFANDSPTLESRDWRRAEYARLAMEMACRQAGIRDPRREIQLFEVDDTYAYKEIQHLIALGVLPECSDLSRALERGATGPGGEIPANVSGGALGMGSTLEASGLYRLVEVTLQLRGHAGPRQLSRIKTGLAQSWRGVPTTSGAVVILEAD